MDEDYHIDTQERKPMMVDLSEYSLVATKFHNGIVLQYDFLPREEALIISKEILDKMLGLV